MKDNQGNYWVEEDYEGYGIFGGKDIYELIAEMNGKTTREEGIDLFFDALGYGNGKTNKILTPNLLRHGEAEWKDVMLKDCDDQGYFYDE
tara:strand:- start:583 stop:852 length:270 start_codon:yes stop_codon:yes gene_type:complete